MNEYCLKLDEYEIANLISALEAGMGFCPSDPDVYARLRSPLTVLNSGDWIGMILNKLRPMCPDSKVRPNRTPEEYAHEARVLDRLARPQLSDDDLTVLEANFNTDSWNLTPAGEDAMLKAMDPQSDAGRPTAPSQAVPEVGLEDVKRIRRTMADGLLAAMDYEIGESEEKGASAETLYEMRRQLRLVAEWLE